MFLPGKSHKTYKNTKRQGVLPSTQQSKKFYNYFAKIAERRNNWKGLSITFACLNFLSDEFRKISPYYEFVRIITTFSVNKCITESRIH